MDLSKPIEIAGNVFWIGYVVPNDPFQCHAYLIRNKDESILIDPGSMITFPIVLEKITSLVKLHDIKYIIMHHQDPDITGCYSTLESIMPKRERFIVTHWRTSMLLKHYGWKTPFYLVDENNWKLQAGDRQIDFIFTPYAHFPGAICSYDRKSEIVFSSDIFGSVNDKFKLFATKDDIGGTKIFHKHYMPTKQILNYALQKIKEKNPTIIAPQHGSIIKDKKVMDYFFKELKDLECGVYLLDDYIDDIFILSKVDDILKEFFELVINTLSFEKILLKLLEDLKRYLPIKKVVVCGDNFTYEVEKDTKFFNTKRNYRCDFKYVLEKNKNINLGISFHRKLSKEEKMFLSLLVKKLSKYLISTLEKDLYIKELEQKKEYLYLKSITDTLTGLYNRAYLNEFLSQKIKEAKRYHFPLSLAIIDIDFFKKINDTCGHIVGDCVLKELSTLLKAHFRGSDLIARYGGEEFVIVMPFTELEKACKKLDFFRKVVENNSFCKEKIKITISAGVNEYIENLNAEKMLKLADEKLYKAKKEGRNKVIC